ncbi:MAG: M15 family metallopeptidase [Pseudomonadota bacterium]
MMIRFYRFIVGASLMTIFSAHALGSVAPKGWNVPKVDRNISANVLYLPISDPAVKAIAIKGSKEELVDLLVVQNPRIKPLSSFDSKYKNTYEGYSKIRRGVYERLLEMLNVLPKNVGIAYFEGLRPLSKQKEYFDKKFKEILATNKDREMAYIETSKQVSPFIDNTPTHATGAAIDITLFSINDKGEELFDMGKFDVIFGRNDEKETFSHNTTEEQRENRIILLDAATKAGLANYGYEWWHYSYGDKMWAYVNGEKEAIYGLAVSPDDPILSIDKASYLKSFD